MRYDLNSTGSATVVNFDATTLPPNVHIPDFIAYNGFEYRVTSIADFALQNCELSTLDLPTDISYIGSYAFQGCQNLVEVFMDKAIKNIGSNPFKGCTSLQKVRITAETPPSSLNDWENISNATLEVPPSSVPAYSSTAPWSSFSSTIALTGEHFWYKGIRYFLNYDGTASVTGFNEEEMDEDVKILSTLPMETAYTVTSIADKAFLSGYWDHDAREWVYTGAGKIKSIVIPGTVKTIGREAFKGCKSLQEVVLGDGIETIGFQAFEMTGLITINIPSSVKRIEKYAFDECHDLAGLVINNGVEVIRSWAFQDCQKLTKIKIPRSVTQLYYDTFNVCYGVTSIEVEGGNTVYDSRNGCNAIIETETNTLIYGCDATIIPDDVITIGLSAFNSAGSITSISIPNSVTTIESGAFHYCRLREVTIGENVTSIGFRAFADCEDMNDVYCYAKTPPSLDDDVFVNYYWSSGVLNSKSYAPNATLHVPASSIGLYKNADQWKDFGNIVALPSEGISTGHEAIDNGELTIDSSLPLYNLHGQRVSHPVKGQIYIQNGRKVKF